MYKKSAAEVANSSGVAAVAVDVTTKAMFARPVTYVFHNAGRDLQ